MTTAYTSLLGLALPVTGELSGTWGDTVNDYITQYLDASVAGTQTISGSLTAVTLSKTTNAALSQAGSGATGSSQYSVINCTGNPASMLTVTVPAASKTYVVVNATSTNQDVKIVGAGPTTGVTLVAGEKAVIAWNGSDFIKVATSTVDGVSTISFGTTGLTPSSATSGAVTVAGTLVAANGGTGQSSYTTGDLLYATGSTALSKLGIGTNGQILTSTGTAPQWSTLSGVAVTTFSAGTTGFTPSSATSGAVTLAGTLATTNGGTGLTSFTANGVVYASSSSALTTGSALTFDGTNFALGAGGDIRAYNTANTRYGRFATITDGTIVESFNGSNEPLILSAPQAGAPIQFKIGGSEQMRLTSTGLGIGTSSPAQKLDVYGNGMKVNNASYVGYLGADSVFGSSGVASSFTVRSDNALTFSTGGPYTRATIDSSGNLGLGVTPSAWTSGYTVAQFGPQGSLSSYSDGSIRLGSNWRDSSGIKYLANGFATLYRQETGTHSWFTAPSGTAGNAISFTQAMTLDANGRLLVGSTSTFGAVSGEISVKATSGGAGVGIWDSSVGAKYQLIAGALGSNAFGLYDLSTSTYRWVVDASGNLGVGTTSQNERIRINSSTAGEARMTIAYNGTVITYFGSYSGIVGSGNADDTFLTSVGAKNLILGSNSTERARITSGGEFLIGQTSGGARLNITAATSQNAVNIVLPSENYLGATIHSTATSGDNQFMAFGTEASFTTRGSISYNRAGGLTAYNTTSDYRAKDIIGPVVNSGATIDALKVYEGKMKGATQARPMMVAHEAQAVVPFCVSGVKDETNEDGTPKYQQMDHASLVPLLIAELQSLRARVAQLEAK